jgi:carotenoid cleavage dioxygenase-like enzyme
MVMGNPMPINPWLDPTHNFGPIDTEFDLPDLPVTGELPPGLNGSLLRNGPNPQFQPIDPTHHHWFLGDGMIHAFTLRDGRAAWRNRWIRTDKWIAEHAAGHSLPPATEPSPKPGEPRDTGLANTNILWHGGRLLALEEGHLPFELDRDSLAARGEQSFGGALHAPFTAHPKIDPATGEMVFFGCDADGPLTPAMTYGTIDRNGGVTRLERFDAPYRSMVHDFAVTERHVLFPVLPLHGSPERASLGGMPFAWEPELGGHIGLLRRDQGVASLRWFRAESCFVFHVLNAWDDGHRIIADVMQFDEAPLFPRADGRPPNPEGNRARLVRWTLDPDAGTDAFTRTELSDISGGLTGEFPRLDDRRAGLPNRFGTFVARGRGANGSESGYFDTIVWMDFLTRRRAIHMLPAGDAASEAVFVPRGPLAAEGDGWLLAVVWRAAERRSDLIVLDTSGIQDGPIATVRLPHRVPFGFHGNWVDASA